MAPAPEDRAIRLVDRRGFLAAGATLVAAACSSSTDTTASSSSAPSTTVAASTTTARAATAPTTAAGASAPGFTAADFAKLGTCSLLPEKTAGPFPLDHQIDRRDITEGYPGHPLRLGLRVLDGRCSPVTGATVELWHADATGDYSAFRDGGGGKDEAEGTTFLRGSQTAGDDGIVEFLTIVPGWYRGRAVHIHVRVHRGGETVVTSQLFFDADQLTAVYGADPYAANGLPDTSNAQDGIAGDPAAEHTLLDLVSGATSRGTGSVALLNLGIG